MKTLRKVRAAAATRSIRNAALGAALVTGLSLSATSASAALIMSVTGVSGSGQTTWELSGNGTASNGNAIRTAPNASYSSRDTWEYSDSFISNTSIQNTVFAITGDASITIDGVTENITHIFLDSDPTFDDLGIRTAAALGYEAHDSVSWTGLFTIDVDISNFSTGLFNNQVGINPGFALNDEIVLSITQLPEPASIALFGLGLAGLGFAKRRAANDRPATTAVRS